MNKKQGVGKSSWTIISGERIERDNRVYVLCECVCGKQKEVILKNVKSGASKSCGCVGRAKTAERNKKHGLRYTRTWRIWQAMKNRCYNKNIPQYKNYGGRGIRVCDEWRNDFVAFYNHFGDIPKHLSIDRKDNDGDYKPSNTKLSTRREQCRNKSNNRKINGKCISEISRELGGGDSLVAKRLARGWDVEKAITTPSYANKKNKKH